MPPRATVAPPLGTKNTAPHGTSADPSAHRNPRGPPTAHHRISGYRCGHSNHPLAKPATTAPCTEVASAPLPPTRSPKHHSTYPGSTYFCAAGYTTQLLQSPPAPTDEAPPRHNTERFRRQENMPGTRQPRAPPPPRNTPSRPQVWWPATNWCSTPPLLPNTQGGPKAPESDASQAGRPPAAWTIRNPGRVQEPPL